MAPILAGFGRIPPRSGNWDPIKFCSVSCALCVFYCLSTGDSQPAAARSGSVPGHAFHCSWADVDSLGARTNSVRLRQFRLQRQAQPHLPIEHRYARRLVVSKTALSIHTPEIPAERHSHPRLHLSRGLATGARGLEDFIGRPAAATDHILSSFPFARRPRALPIL